MTESQVCYLCGGFSDEHSEGCVQPFLDTLRKENDLLRSSLREALDYIENEKGNSYLDIKTARKLIE